MLVNRNVREDKAGDEEENDLRLSGQTRLTRFCPCASDTTFTSHPGGTEKGGWTLTKKQARVVAAATLGSKQAHFPKVPQITKPKDINTKTSHTQHAHSHQIMQLAAQ